ncbi:MAG: SUMF1/EgtB/PvdO family nonheme iron enzyme [Alistipes sp.]|nr:SUMF1/EgtB/PvdO family nonheme iron enzyme [Alistipes sp.]
MKRLLTIPFLLLALVTTAQSVTKSIIIDPQSFKAVQTDALTGVNIDPIALDYSKRECARLKIKVNRMTKEEIDGLQVKPVTNNAVMKCKTAEYDNGLIVELTAKPQTRFYLHHEQFGDSNEVTLDLEGNKEYRLEVSLNQQYPITVASNVEGAEVYLDNIYKGTTNSDYVLTIKDVLPGTYTLKVVHGGATHEKAIVVSSSSVFFKQEVNIAASQPQFVVFQVEPATAIVRLDGAILTLTDGMAMKSMKQGTYSYIVDAENYHSEQGTIVVKGEKVVKPIRLRPAFGYLDIKNTAKGAAVYIDNRLVSTSPGGNIQLSLASGKHSLQIVQSKFKPYTADITITDGNVTSITPRFDANFAVVTLVADSGTEILVNNQVKGTQSWSGELEMGVYRIECRKSGHKSAIQSVEITSSQPRTINLTLPTPIYGSANIISTPLMASVAIDGKSVGETPLTLNNILVGKHTLTISKVGYTAYSQEISVVEGGVVDINKTLTKATTQTATNPQQSNTTLVSNGIYKVGDYYNENGMEGIVFSVSADGRSGKIVYPKCSPSELMWAVGSEQQKFIGANDAYDGAKNLAVVQRISGWQKKYPIFAWCAALGRGWYPPAKEEMAEIRRNKAKIESKLSRNLGVYFWTSTESNAAKYQGEHQAWNISHEGRLDDYCKSRTNYTFAIAKFSSSGVSVPSNNGSNNNTTAQVSTDGRITFTVNGINFNMILVEGGTFPMGVKGVTTTVSSFYIGETEVTQELWQSVMHQNNSMDKGPQRPVHYETWNDYLTFTKKLSQITGRKFRLPTEAEWEFAARGGNKSRGYKYSGSNILDEVAVHGIGAAANVKTKKPNELGIYDMSGNACEFCSDWYVYTHNMPTTPQTNPKGPSSGTDKVWKGGYYYGDSAKDYGVITYRNYDAPTNKNSFGGFRLVLEVE